MVMGQEERKNKAKLEKTQISLATSNSEYEQAVKALEDTKTPVTSVDAPSSWNIETGPPESGLGSKFNPNFLISLTAPKPLVKHFRGRHFIGGRFVASLSPPPPRGEDVFPDD